MAGIQFRGNQRTAPAWMADWAGREHLALFPAKLDPAQFQDVSGIKVAATANAIVGATSIAVTALDFSSLPNTTTISKTGNVLIPKGTTLNFTGNKLAVTTADVLWGATSIPVVALLAQINTGDVAYYNKYGGIFVPSGTLVGRTYTERDANTPFGAGDYTTPDDELMLTAFDVPDLLLDNNVELYRIGERIYENYLPDYANFAGGKLTKIRALYQSSKAAN